MKSAPSMPSRKKWRSCITSNKSTMSSSPESRTLGTDGVDDRGGGTDEASEGEVGGAGKGSASEGLEVRGADPAAGDTAGNDPGGGLTATAGASSTAGGGGGVGACGRASA